MKTTPLPKFENFDGLVVVFALKNVKRVRRMGRGASVEVGDLNGFRSLVCAPAVPEGGFRLLMPVNRQKTANVVMESVFWLIMRAIKKK